MSNATIKNARVDAAGMKPLSQDDLYQFAGIEGPATDARIGEILLFGGVEATLVLCDNALGVFWSDEKDDMRAYQANNIPRFVLELIAVELLTCTRNAGTEITEQVLERFGFESHF